MTSVETSFDFGSNWQKFLADVTPERVAAAESSLGGMLGVALSGKKFLDVGCGSGLFSLAARRLGAKVFSFDVNPRSVACAEELRRRDFPDDLSWTVRPGSALDAAFMEGLGLHDVVYAWGVLHHTGEMWRAVDLAAARVAPGGRLFLALYNDQGWRSRAWHAVKRAYNAAPGAVRPAILGVSFLRLWGPTLAKDFLRGRPGASWRTYHHQRGMSPWRDVVDWVGGYPFEVASPPAVESFLGGRGFRVVKRALNGGSGCNEFILEKQS